METPQIVDELKAVARKLDLDVRVERGRFRGGRCQVDGERIIMLNKRHPPEAHLAILAESLRDQPLDTLFIKPAVRAALQAAWDQPAPAEAPAADVE